MSGTLQDARFAARLICRNPGYALVTVLVLALGVGATTAVFSALDAVLLRPLPYGGAARIVVIQERTPQGRRHAVSAANFDDWRLANRSFAETAAFTPVAMNLAGQDRPEQIRGFRVSASYFRLLGIQPARGRDFLLPDDQPGAPRVAILSHGYWQRRLGSDPGAIGTRIVLNSDPYVVVGILPDDPRLFSSTLEVWTPLALDPARVKRDFHFMIVLGRLAADVTLAQARLDMDGIAAGLAAAYPRSNRGWGVSIEPLREWLSGDRLRQTTLVLFGAIGFVLLSACVSVSCLMLARGAAREREMAIRAALGATRARIARQLLIESIVLALCGGGLGYLLAAWFAISGEALLPAGTLPPAMRLMVDARLAGFALFVAVGAGVIAGLAPALRPGSGPTLRALVVIETALAVVLLAGAGVLARSLLRLEQVELGFRSGNLLTFQVTLPLAGYSSLARTRGFHQEALARLAALPGARSAALATVLPLQGWRFGMPFEIEGRPAASESERPAANFQIVSSGYFSTMGIALVRGRSLADSDDHRATRVAVVNETFVRRFLSDVEGLGKRLRIAQLVPGKAELGVAVSWEIVGVTRDVKVSGPAAAAEPEIYVPFIQHPWNSGVIMVRTIGDPLAMAQAARRAIQSLDPELPLTQVRAMEDIVAEASSQPRFRTAVLGIFAALALILAMLGIYGVLAHAISRRRHEIGIRMALGAQRGDVMRIVLGQGLRLAGSGIALGLAGAVALTRLLRGLLFEVSPTDPAVFAAVSMLLAGVALLASWIPAHRAMRVDPALALRD